MTEKIQTGIASFSSSPSYKTNKYYEYELLHKMRKFFKPYMDDACSSGIIYFVNRKAKVKYRNVKTNHTLNNK